MNTHCDVFLSLTQQPPTYLYANVGELRSTLAFHEWRHVGMGVTPLFAARSIAKQGYHLEKLPPKGRERSWRLYRK